VVLMPGMGDDVQSLKAGLMEIGDIFVLNKSDREGADRFEQQLRAILQLVPERNGWKPPVVRTWRPKIRASGSSRGKSSSFARILIRPTIARAPRNRVLEGMDFAASGSALDGTRGRTPSGRTQLDKLQRKSPNERRTRTAR
jgi:LAO/AO transport system kinase